MPRKTVTTSVVLSPELVAEIDKIRSAFERHPLYRLGTPSQSAVVRMLLARGLEALKKEIGGEPPA